MAATASAGRSHPQIGWCAVRQIAARNEIAAIRVRAPLSCAAIGGAARQGLSTFALVPKPEREDGKLRSIMARSGSFSTDSGMTMPQSIGWHDPHVDWMRNCASNGQRSLRDYPGWNAIFAIRGLRRAGAAAAGHRFIVPALDSARAVPGARAKDAATAMIEPPACAADRRLRHGLGASASDAVARRHPGTTPPGWPPAVPASQPQ